MITTGGNKPWKSDICISDCKEQGLYPKSVIRMKIFTLDNRFILKRIGDANSKDWGKVKDVILREVLEIEN